jgi:curved DNA-binding protein CbpA
MADPSGERPDLYRVLGLSPGASRADIVRAYRQQIRAVHPDARPADPDASARFRQLTEAYDVLSDPSRRDAYDQRRLPAAPPPARPARPGPKPRQPGPGVPLWAGPVHIQPAVGSRAPQHVSPTPREALLAYLISRYAAFGDWASGDWTSGDWADEDWMP